MTSKPIKNPLTEEQARLIAKHLHEGSMEKAKDLYESSALNMVTWETVVFKERILDLKKVYNGRQT